MNKHVRSKRIALFLSISAMFPIISSLMGCAATYRIHGTVLDQGSLQLAQVVVVATKNEIFDSPDAHTLLSAGGVKDSDINNGSIVVARVFCCGGPNEISDAVMIYVPPALQVEMMDVLEFVVGKKSSKPGEQVLNIAARIRQRGTSKEQKCRWFPEDPSKWMRVLYCNGLESEGWEKRGGLYPVWYKSTTR